MRSVADIINQAFAYHREGRGPEAAVIYDKLLGMMDDPDPNLLMGYGLMLVQDGHNGLAKHLLKEAVSKLPDKPETAPAWCNLGVCLKHLDREEAAQECYAKSIELEPNNPQALSNMAGLYINSGSPEIAEAWARKAIALQPEYPQGHNHLALALMEQMRWNEAWPHWEYRWKLPENLKNVRDYGCSKWDGKSHVHTLVIHGEQGLGDEILYMSVLDKVRPFAKRIVIECADRLMKLFEESFDLEVHPNATELKKYVHAINAYIPMGSLMGLVGLPSGRPFLKTKPKPYIGKPLVGIAWKGGIQRTHKKVRTLKLRDLQPILDVPGVEFINLQYGGPEIVGEAEQVGLRTPDDRSFQELAHWIAACDLVITPCQTNVHVAGGLGIPTWCLTPTAHAWRYSSPDNQMLFYDSVKLYRQRDHGKWEPVIHKIAADLAERYVHAG